MSDLTEKGRTIEAEPKVSDKPRADIPEYLVPKPPADFSPRTALIVVGVIFLLAVVGGGFLWRRHQVVENQKVQAYQADKPKFAKLESDMQAGYAAMLAAAGKPAKQGETKSCAPGAADSQIRTLTCTMAYNFIYGVSDIQEARSLSAQLANTLTKQAGFTLKPESPTLDSLGQSFGKSNTVRLGMYAPSMNNCELAIALNSSNLPLYKGIDKPNVADYFFTCNRATSKPIYSLAK